LVYHSVTVDDERDDGQMTVSARRLEEQLRAIAESGYVVMDAVGLVSALRAGSALPARAVVITFDDGYRNVLTSALPVLARFGFPATAFLVSAFIDGDVAATRGDHAGPFLTAAEARELAASGLVRIGSHGWAHQRLRGLDDETLRIETEAAKVRLEERLGVNVDLFAYPFGSFGSWDRRARDAVVRAGYDAAFTSIVGPIQARDDPYLLPRTRVSWMEDDAAIRRLLAGGYDWYAGWQRLQATIVR
jgi:peptidoglycan/xylan/chitin deacetylase (PgdA/CDA1 family)